MISNWIYNEPSRKTNWFEARFKELNSPYEDYPGNVADGSREAFDAYLRYVDYMVRHFKDRVTYFEIANEWEWEIINVNKYIKKIFEPTYQAIKEAAPESKILIGSLGYMLKQWLINMCGPGVIVENNRLIAAGAVVLLVKGVNRRNVIIKMDTSSDVKAGFVLPVKTDSGKYLTAIYDPENKSVYFYESHEQWGWGVQCLLTEPEKLEVKQCEYMGRELHLEARVEESTVTFTVSDGIKTISTSYTSEKVMDEANTGLIHFPVNINRMADKAEFSNYMVTDLQGNIIFKDEFNSMDTTENSWDILWNYWGDKGKLPPALKVDALGYHTGSFPDLGYYEEVRTLKKECERLGFKGKFLVTEMYISSAYPPPRAISRDRLCFGIQHGEVSDKKPCRLQRA